MRVVRPFFRRIPATGVPSVDDLYRIAPVRQPWWAGRLLLTALVVVGCGGTDRNRGEGMRISNDLQEAVHITYIAPTYERFVAELDAGRNGSAVTFFSGHQCAVGRLVARTPTGAEYEIDQPCQGSTWHIAPEGP